MGLDLEKTGLTWRKVVYCWRKEIKSSLAAVQSTFFILTFYQRGGDISIHITMILGDISIHITMCNTGQYTQCRPIHTNINTCETYHTFSCIPALLKTYRYRQIQVNLNTRKHINIHTVGTTG